MSYGASTYRMLISSPGDVPESDVDVIMRTVARWNANYGRSFGSTVVLEGKDERVYLDQNKWVDLAGDVSLPLSAVHSDHRSIWEIKSPHPHGVLPQASRRPILRAGTTLMGLDCMVLRSTSGVWLRPAGNGAGRRRSSATSVRRWWT